MESHPASTESRPTSGATRADPDAGPVVARFAAPRTDEPTAIAVISDPHLSTAKSGTWKVFHRTADRLRTAVADVNRRDTDAVVFAGDLTEDGRPEDFAAVDDLLSALRVPWLAVPGNHDVPKSFDDHETPPLSAFEATYTPDGLPFRASVGGVDVFGLNSALPRDGGLDDTHRGVVGGDQLGWLTDELAAADTDPEASVVVMHHNLGGVGERTGDHAWRSSFPVGDDEALTGVLADHGVPLHVSGHLHQIGVAETAGVRQLVCPALGSFPQAYLRLEVGPAGTVVRFVPVADSAGIEEAYMHARADSSRSRAMAAATVAELAAAPLADETPRRRPLRTRTDR